MKHMYAIRSIVPVQTMAWLKLFPTLVVCFHGLDSSSLLLNDKYANAKWVTVPVVTSALSSRYLDYVKIPMECEELGFCDFVSSYPEKEAENLIRMIQDTILFSNIQMNQSMAVENRMRYIAGHNPCPSEKFDVPPVLAKHSDNNWYYILPINRIIGEKCADENQEPEDFMLNVGYEPKCIQKYVYKDLWVIIDGKPIVKTFDIKAVCSCVAVADIMDA